VIEFFNQDTELPKIDFDRISLWINKIITNHNKIEGDITYIFCSDNYILDINQKYLSHDYFTDIITFNYNKDNIISGDIFISVDTVFNNSKIYKQTFETELHRVMIHGILHLLGYDDHTETDIANMRKAENDSLLIL
jgi:rRNA maturation RNase YbeY